MKHFLFACALLLLFCMPARSAEKQRDTLKVIAIGNSFTDDPMALHLRDIALADGQPVVLANMFIGACSMEMHAKNIQSGKANYTYRKNVDGKWVNQAKVTLETGLEDEDWDVVVLQQGKGLYGVYESYFPYINTVMDFAREHVKGPFRFAMQQVWASPKNTIRRDIIGIYDFDQKKMYEADVEVPARLARELGIDIIIPTATAIQNGRRTYMRENFTRDGHHLGHYTGRYMAACTWYEALTGRSCVGNRYKPKNIPPMRVATMQHCAHAAILEPSKVTDLGDRAPKMNYDESKILPYTLPDPLLCLDGTRVRNKKEWEEKRRPELVSLFEKEMYGRALGRPDSLHFSLIESSEDALGGLARRRQVAIYLTPGDEHPINLLMYLPKKAKGPVPVFLGMNFGGNWAVCYDPSILMPSAQQLKSYGIIENWERGREASQWPLEHILSAGYGVCTYYRGDVDPDYDDGFGNGVHRFLYKKGPRFPKADEWGTIAAWAWGLSRCLDYLETDSEVDSKRVSVIGTSRLGKAALWAGALDQRFAMVISNCSGAGGATLSRRQIAETVKAMNMNFNHWFCANFKKYGDNVDSLPFDQHELLCLVAPRPLCIGSASEDIYCDPHGEQLSSEAAEVAYRLYGRKGRGKISYHIRQGKHDITAEDWQVYIDFANKNLKH